MRTDSCLRAALLLIVLFAAAETRAGDMCPAPPHHVARTPADVAADDHQIHIDADGISDAISTGVLGLTGHVVVKQDDRSLTADSVTYTQATGHVTVNGAVDFEDPLIRVQSESGTYDTNGGADFKKSTFELLDRAGRGSATDIGVRPAGKISLDQVRYTTCPVGDKDWMLQASSINLDTVMHQGVARHAWIEFKGVPIFYTPYLSFPMDSERKSGLLAPILDHSGTNGYELGVTYYFNLASNYDLTLSPEYLSARGVELGSQFRYLTSTSHGQIDANVLPNDIETNDDRFFFHATDTTDFKPGLRGEVDRAVGQAGQHPGVPGDPGQSAASQDEGSCDAHGWLLGPSAVDRSDLPTLGRRRRSGPTARLIPDVDPVCRPRSDHGAAQGGRPIGR